MYRKTTKASAIYHIKDSIEHFQFNVSFRQINSLLNLPKFDVKTGGSLIETNSRCDADKVKVITIKWQEKHFSPQEIEFYRDVKNCSTDVHKSYHQLILRDEDDFLRLSSNPIFTYVDGDGFVPDEEKANWPNDSDSTTSDVLMFVYAALNLNIMLVSLRWQPLQRILHIYPDFNNFQDKPYLIEIDTDYRHLYAYGIENISKQHLGDRDVSLLSELQLPKIPHWEDIDKLSDKFAMPPKRTRRIVIHLEILRAKGFEFDDLHVRYHVHLPEATILEDGSSTGCTHSSKMNNDGVCNFAHCCEITLLCEEDFDFGNMCHVYFEIISIDNWERERLEGYSHFSFFLEQGFEISLLQCHRPVEGGIMEKLYWYFIGGRRKFDFVRFYSGGGDFCNRYGTQMVATGSLALRCQIISQQNPELLKPVPGQIVGMTLEDIMKAYREARKRLEAVVLD